MVSQELIYVYISHESKRALNRLVAARLLTELTAQCFPPETAIMLYFKSSTQNELNGWVTATIVFTTDHTIVFRRREKGLPMNISYGDVRQIPDNNVALQLSPMESGAHDHESDYYQTDDQVGTIWSTTVQNPAK